MYLEHEEVLKLVNTLEKERDEARRIAVRFARLFRDYRVRFLKDNTDSDLIAHKVKTDLLLGDCDEVCRRYTPQ